MNTFCNISIDTPHISIWIINITILLQSCYIWDGGKNGKEGTNELNSMFKTPFSHFPYLLFSTHLRHNSTNHFYVAFSNEDGSSGFLICFLILPGNLFKFMKLFPCIYIFRPTKLHFYYARDSLRYIGIWVCICMYICNASMRNYVFV